MLRLQKSRWVVVALLVLVVGVLWISNLAKMWHIASLSDESDDVLEQAVAELRAERTELDETVWSREVLAQRYEDYFVKLWDDLRGSDDKYSILARIVFGELKLGKPAAARKRGEGVTSIQFAGDGKVLSPSAWRNLLMRAQQQGYRLVQCEWHHQTFDQDVDGVVRSGVNVVLHIAGEAGTDLIEISGPLTVYWSDEKDATGNFLPDRVDASHLTMLRRTGPPAFERVFSTDRLSVAGPSNWQHVLVHDLNRDGLSDFVTLADNRVYYNRGNFRFEHDVLCAQPMKKATGGLIADVTGDGYVDLLALGTPPAVSRTSEKSLVLYRGDARGRFHGSPLPGMMHRIMFHNPDAITAGDIDGDGDLDLWITQYKSPYMGGQMPTPYYDANDGWPAYLLINNGLGQFEEVTAATGLAEKRHRRTYRSSFIDLDEDDDLDLVVVSDFAGTDVHLNDGHGNFTDATANLLDEATNFGMSHAFGDFNADGNLDMYVTGMASTTARRLDQMGLGRANFADYQKMRSVIAYGNRMYLRGQDAFYSQPDFRDQVARCGWSWGSASLDFDSDGDEDIYVANGHNSGKSAKDYCTKFWRHDIYSGSSQEDPVLNLLFMEELFGGFSGEGGAEAPSESWNGYEHNRLLMNEGGTGFLNVGFLAGLALEADCRQVVADDFDIDGKPDLLIGWLDRSRGETKLVFSIFRNTWLAKDRAADGATGGKRNNWIGIRARGIAGVSPLGARVTVAYADGRQVAAIVAGDSFASQHAPLKHFGLGTRSEVDFINVKWPGGLETRLDEPKINRYHDVSPPSR